MLREDSLTLRGDVPRPDRIEDVAPARDLTRHLGGFFGELAVEFAEVAHDNVTGRTQPDQYSGKGARVRLGQTSWRRPIEVSEEDATIFRAAAGTVGNNAGLANNTFLELIIGDYGEDFALTLMAATRQILSDWWKYSYLHRDDPLTPRDAAVHHALWAATFQRDIEQTMAEGIQTVGQALAVLTADRIPGFEDNPRGLLVAISGSDVLNELASWLPYGRLADASLGGYRFAVTPIEVEGSTVRLTEAVKELLLPEKTEHSRANTVRLSEPEQRMEAAEQGEAQRGRGCPATVVLSQAMTAIDAVADLVVRQAVEFLSVVPVEAQAEQHEERRWEVRNMGAPVATYRKPGEMGPLVAPDPPPASAPKAP